MDVQVEVREDYLLFKPSGRVSESGMFELASIIHDKAISLQSGAALIDCAGMTGSIDAVALFNIGERFARLLSSFVRLAAINMPAEWRLNDFCEDVVANRGGALRHFDSLESAEAWFRSGED